MNKISSIKLNIFKKWEEDLYLFFKNLNLKNNIFINFDSIFDGKNIIINVNEKKFDDYNCKKRNKCPIWNELMCNEEINKPIQHLLSTYDLKDFSTLVIKIFF